MSELTAAADDAATTGSFVCNRSLWGKDKSGTEDSSTTSAPSFNTRSSLLDVSIASAKQNTQ